MALNRDETTSVINKFGKDARDTGASQVQVALLTERIKGLTVHRNQFKKDKSAARSMQILVGKRRKLLQYMRRTNLDGYRALIKELGLRK
ncbi:MAG: 30S ribosomal protein S15 [Spirochaetaceae bacterium]|nr:30S ribosomal protein S15 [Spirochaetaceae bacterium]